MERYEIQDINHNVIGRFEPDNLRCLLDKADIAAYMIDTQTGDFLDLTWRASDD